MCGGGGGGGGWGDCEEEVVIELGLHAKLREKITNLDSAEKIYDTRERSD